MVDMPKDVVCLTKMMPITSIAWQYKLGILVIAVLLMPLLVNIEAVGASTAKYEMQESGGSIALTNVYGADANTTGNPIGGGLGYNDIFKSGDYIVATADELVAALRKATAGQVVYVQSGVEIDLTKKPGLQIASGVTLAGDRGNGASLGPLLYTTSTFTNPLFGASGPNVRVTGLRLRGADGGSTPIDGIADNLSVAIQSMYANLEVDNCEIYNFSRTGVLVDGQDGYVHHNYIHHVQRDGLGYPVAVTATALIEANIFDYYRHAIAATGFPGNGYEARFNIVYEHAISHVFDMHGGGDFCVKQYSFHPYCTDEEWYMAGDWISVHHNTFYTLNYKSVVFRGAPTQFGEVHHNWFMHTQPMQALAQIYFTGNVTLYDNVYGPNKSHIGNDKQPSFLIRDIGGLQLMGITGTKYGCIVDLVELPTNQLHIGFASPLKSDGFSEVSGIVPIEVEINQGGLLKIAEVQVLLDDKIIYSGKEAPIKGSLQIDSTQLDGQVHRVTLKITDASGGTVKRVAQIRSVN